MDVEAASIEWASPLRSDNLGSPERNVAFKEPDMPVDPLL